MQSRSDMHGKAPMRFNASLVSVVMMLVFLSPLFFAMVYFAIGRVYWPIIPIFAFVFYILADVATSSIIVSEKEISFRHFWKKRWSAEIADVSIKDGKGGDLGLLPVMFVVKRKGGAKVGTIKKTYFRPADLALIRQKLERNESEIRQRASL